jgi:hypothetical protein
MPLFLPLALRVARESLKCLALIAPAMLPLHAAPVLPDLERAAVYRAALLEPRDGSHYREGCAAALRPDTEVLDLDRDGQAEVLVYLGPSPCFAETQGGNVALFMKDAQGRWIDRLGFVPGVEVVLQEGPGSGLPDLGVANPGGCMLVYRWNGSRYVQASQRAIQPGGCQVRG